MMKLTTLIALAFLAGTIATIAGGSLHLMSDECRKRTDEVAHFRAQHEDEGLIKLIEDGIARDCRRVWGWVR